MLDTQKTKQIYVANNIFAENDASYEIYITSAVATSHGDMKSWSTVTDAKGGNGKAKWYNTAPSARALYCNVFDRDYSTIYTGTIKGAKDSNGAPIDNILQKNGSVAANLHIFGDMVKQNIVSRSATEVFGTAAPELKLNGSNGIIPTLAVSSSADFSGLSQGGLYHFAATENTAFGHKEFYFQKSKDNGNTWTEWTRLDDAVFGSQFFFYSEEPYQKTVTTNNGNVTLWVDDFVTSTGTTIQITIGQEYYWTNVWDGWHNFNDDTILQRPSYHFEWYYSSGGSNDKASTSKGAFEYQLKADSQKEYFINTDMTYIDRHFVDGRGFFRDPRNVTPGAYQVNGYEVMAGATDDVWYQTENNRDDIYVLTAQDNKFAHDLASAAGMLTGKENIYIGNTTLTADNIAISTSTNLIGLFENSTITGTGTLFSFSGYNQKIGAGGLNLVSDSGSMFVLNGAKTQMTISDSTLRGETLVETAGSGTLWEFTVDQVSAEVSGMAFDVALTANGSAIIRDSSFALDGAEGIISLAGGKLLTLDNVSVSGSGNAVMFELSGIALEVEGMELNGYSGTGSTFFSLNNVDATIRDLAVRNSSFTGNIANIAGKGEISFIDTVLENNAFASTAETAAFYANSTGALNLTFDGMTASGNSGWYISVAGSTGKIQLHEMDVKDGDRFLNYTGSGSLTLTDSAVRSMLNTAVVLTGTNAVINFSGNLFQHNAGNSTAGAIHGQLTGGSLTVTDTMFRDNSSKTASGGMHISGSSNAVVTMFEVEFRRSYSESADGGALSVISSDNTLTLTVDTAHFNANSTSGNGGAVYVADLAQAYFNRVTFDDNTARRLNGDLTFNTAAFGGAIYLKNTHTVINNGTYLRNTAHNGGAIYVEGSDLTVISSTFVFNSAGDGGSLIVLEKGEDGTVSNLNLANSLFQLNGVHEDFWCVDGDYVCGGSDSSAMQMWFCIFDKDLDKLGNLIEIGTYYDRLNYTESYYAKNDYLQMSGDTVINASSGQYRLKLLDNYLNMAFMPYEKGGNANNMINMFVSYGGSSYAPLLVLQKQITPNWLEAFGIYMITDTAVNGGLMTPVIEVHGSQYLLNGTEWKEGLARFNYVNMNTDARGYWRESDVYTLNDDYTLSYELTYWTAGSYQLNGASAHLYETKGSSSESLGFFVSFQDALDYAAYVSGTTGNGVMVSVADGMVANATSTDFGQIASGRFDNTSNFNANAFYAVGIRDSDYVNYGGLDASEGYYNISIVASSERSGLRVPFTYDYYSVSNSFTGIQATLLLITGNGHLTIGSSADGQHTLRLQGPNKATSTVGDTNLHGGILRHGGKNGNGAPDTAMDWIMGEETLFDFSLTVDNVFVDGSSANYGGAFSLYAVQDVIIRNTVFKNVHSGRSGGAIYYVAPGTVHFTEVTDTTTTTANGAILPITNTYHFFEREINPTLLIEDTDYVVAMPVDT